jgi:hypothetical protein
VFYCFVCLHPVSCFPNVVSSVFGLSLSVFILFLVFPMLPVVSPDCPCLSSSCFLFSQCCQLCLWIVLVCLHPVSCFPNVASSVSGLSLFVFIVCLVFPMLPVVSPDCPIAIVPSVFFIVYLNTEICFDSKFRSKTYNKTKQ